MLISAFFFVLFIFILFIFYFEFVFVGCKLLIGPEPDWLLFSNNSLLLVTSIILIFLVGGP